MKTALLRNRNLAAYAAAAVSLVLTFLAPGVGEAGIADNSMATFAENTARSDDGCLAVIAGAEFGESPSDVSFSMVERAGESEDAPEHRAADRSATRCIILVVIPKMPNGDMPDIAGRTFSLGDSASYEKFAGAVFVFSGGQPAQKRIDQGTIFFGADASAPHSFFVAYDMTMPGGESPAAPAYQLADAFSVTLSDSGPAGTAPAEMYAALR